MIQPPIQILQRQYFLSFAELTYFLTNLDGTRIFMATRRLRWVSRAL